MHTQLAQSFQHKPAPWPAARLHVPAQNPDFPSPESGALVVQPVIMAQSPRYLLADASAAAHWNSHYETGSAVQGVPNCKHRLAFPILVPAWIELIGANVEWSKVKVMRHSPTDSCEDENTWVPTWLIESAFGPYYLPQVLPEQASLKCSDVGLGRLSWCSTTCQCSSMKVSSMILQLQ